MEDFEKIVSSTKRTFKLGKTMPIKFREAQLKGLIRLCDENVDELQKALHMDLRKNKFEAMVAEIFFLKKEVMTMLTNLEEWMKPQAQDKDIVNVLDDILIYKDPYGVVLIIGAWNYPVQLCLSPLAGAIAAGNCAIIKPSEIAPHTAKLLARLIPKYLDKDCYKIILGGKEETTELLKQRFDYIFFTGSTEVGKIVYQAAAQFLTPVTLELGGKSPVYIDKSANIENTARRILWGKLINSGQTCIAPDYILCTKPVQKKFITACKKALEEFYSNDIQKSPDFCRIINENHFNRLTKLIGSGRVAIGGHYDLSDKYIEPTILIDIRAEDPIMQEEIFGPILPIINIDNHVEAIEFINNREKPLALYIFSSNKLITQSFLENTSSGGVTVNDIAMHYAVDCLPFGGVGNSGMGSYHGKYSFDLFSHDKSTLIKNLGNFGEKMLSVRYPPYSHRKLSFLLQLLKPRKFWSLIPLSYVIAFALGVIFAKK